MLRTFCKEYSYSHVRHTMSSLVSVSLNMTVGRKAVCDEAVTEPCSHVTSVLTGAVDHGSVSKFTTQTRLVSSFGKMHEWTEKATGWRL